MKNFPANMCIAACLFLSLSLIASGQEVHQVSNTSSSCRNFVKRFYTWYSGIAVPEKKLRRSDLALRYRPYLFSTDLAGQLRQDSSAQKKAGSNLVSVDADPFVGPDGPAEAYRVERTTVNNGKCWAAVHSIWGGKESGTPDVTPELELKAGRWIFVNFYFPSPKSPKALNLLQEAKSCRELRKKHRAGGN